MSDSPGRSIPDLWDPSPSSARNAPRRVGEYLLVAQLGDDALGSVYRALRTSDGHFVRLRVLQSPDLSLRDTLAAIERQSPRRGTDSGEVDRCGELHVADGIPYLVWPEKGGWTLDFVLARARAGRWGLPLEFALLIAQRAAAEIEQACALAGALSHGALWPGFVSVSSDAEVCVEGFGLAQVILPSLSKPRMWRDIAPYIAPEVRATGLATESSDVYSIGVLMLELVTGQRASADTPPARWRADDDFSQELSLLLRLALSDPTERFSSMRGFRSALEGLIASCPFEASPADLALFFYDRLNPESRTLPAPFDGSSTNPLTDRCRPEAPVQPLAMKNFDLAAEIAKDLLLLDEASDETTSVAQLQEQTPSFPPPAVAVRASEGPAPWVRGISRAAVIAAAAVGLLLVETTTPRAPAPPPSATAAPPLLLSAAPTLSPSAAIEAVRLVSAPIMARVRRTKRAGGFSITRRSTARPPSAGRAPQSEIRPETETFRLKAALARIEAERIDAPIHASATFAQARAQESEAQQRLSRGDLLDARDGYAKALELFTQAQSLSREERVRQIQIASDGSAP